MAAATFDALAYAKKLEAVGFTREQAETQASALREAIDERAVSREFLDSRLRETELRLQNEIEKTRYSLLKWQIGGWLALAAIMAKGFHWLGF